jgi:hypothetical protein
MGKIHIIAANGKKQSVATMRLRSTGLSTSARICQGLPARSRPRPIVLKPKEAHV